MNRNPHATLVTTVRKTRKAIKRRCHHAPWYYLRNYVRRVETAHLLAGNIRAGREEPSQAFMAIRDMDDILLEC